MNDELQKLVSAGRLPKMVANKLSLLEPGAFCLHKSWGPGRIKEWDLLGHRVLIDFDNKPAHPMKLEFAAKSLEVLEEDHILARRVADLESLQAEAKENPAEVVAATLRSHDSEMLLDQFEDVIKGSVIAEGSYKSWWEATKKKLRTDRRFVVPSKRNDPMILRDEDLTPADAMVQDFLQASTLKLKAKAGAAVLKDIGAFKDTPEKLQPVVDDINAQASKAAKLTPGPVIDLLIVREQLEAEVESLKPESTEGRFGIASVLKQEKGKLFDLATGLSVASLRRVLNALPDAFEDDWAKVAAQLMNKVSIRTVTEIARHLTAENETDTLLAGLRGGIQHRTISADALVWICKEREGNAKELFSGDLPACILQVLERDYYDEDASRSNRLHDALLNDAPLVADLMELCDKNAAKSFTRRLLGSPVFEELNRRSLLMRVVKIHPHVGDLIGGEEAKKEAKAEADGTAGSTGPLIVSWESLNEKKAMFEKLVKTDIPANTKEISVAREHGDLRENFEFKAAKEKQAVLMRMKDDVELEIQRGQGTDFVDADTSKVNIGTIVDFENVASGDKETVTILGAWDSDPSKGILSYLTGIGDALLGAAPGEERELPSTDGAGDKRKVKVLEIRPYAVA